MAVVCVKKGEQGIMLVVWVEVLLGLMQGEWGYQSGMAFEGELSPDMAKTASWILLFKKVKEGVLYVDPGLHTTRRSVSVHVSHWPP